MWDGLGLRAARPWRTSLVWFEPCTAEGGWVGLAAAELLLYSWGCSLALRCEAGMLTHNGACRGVTTQQAGGRAPGGRYSGTRGEGCLVQGTAGR